MIMYTGITSSFQIYSLCLLTISTMSKRQKLLIREEEINNDRKKAEYECTHARRYTIHFIKNVISITYNYLPNKNTVSLANLKQFVLPYFQNFSDTQVEDIIFQKTTRTLLGTLILI